MKRYTIIWSALDPFLFHTRKLELPLGSAFYCWMSMLNQYVIQKGDLLRVRNEIHLKLNIKKKGHE